MLPFWSEIIFNLTCTVILESNYNGGHDIVASYSNNTFISSLPCRNRHSGNIKSHVFSLTYKKRNNLNFNFQPNNVKKEVSYCQQN